MALNDSLLMLARGTTSTVFFIGEDPPPLSILSGAFGAEMVFGTTERRLAKLFLVRVLNEVGSLDGAVVELIAEKLFGPLSFS